MEIKSMQQNLTRPCIHCLHIQHPNMYCQTGNSCCVVVLIEHGLIFYTKNKIGIIPTHLLQYVFIFICELHVGQCMEDEHQTKILFRLCLQDPDTVTPAKLHTRKYLVIMETSIADFHTSFYIPEIKKLAFQLTNVHILGTNHFGNTRHEEFKRRRSFQDVLCYHDYAERVVDSFFYTK